MPTLLQTEELLKKMAPLVVTASRSMQLIWTQKLIERDGLGIVAISQARVTAMAAMNDDEFARAIKKYKWTKDEPFDWVPLPWQVVARKADDCDGSAVLCCATRKACKMYLICAFNGNLPMRFDEWHYIAVQQQPEGFTVWSNFKMALECRTSGEYRAWIKKNYKWATMLVEVDPTMKGNPRALIKSFSAL